MRFQRPLMAFFLIVLCVTVPCLAGCGKKRATVKGKVTFMGKPVTAGNVSFVGEGERVGSGNIHSDGTYTVKNAPVGETTVTVQTPPRPRGPMAMNKAKRPAGVPAMPKEMLPPDYEENKNVPSGPPVPEKYNKVDSSTIKYTVKPGVQEYDIDLKP